MSTAAENVAVEKPGLSRHAHNVENAGSNPAGATNLPEAPEPPTEQVRIVVVAVPQIPGCLPLGYDMDSLLTVEQFAIWRQRAISTIRAQLASTRGVIRRSREDVMIHPRTFLEKSLSK